MGRGGVKRNGGGPRALQLAGTYRPDRHGWVHGSGVRGPDVCDVRADAYAGRRYGPVGGNVPDDVGAARGVNDLRAARSAHRLYLGTLLRLNLSSTTERSDDITITRTGTAARDRRAVNFRVCRSRMASRVPMPKDCRIRDGRPGNDRQRGDDDRSATRATGRRGAIAACGDRAARTPSAALSRKDRDRLTRLLPVIAGVFGSEPFAGSVRYRTTDFWAVLANYKPCT